MHGVRIHSLAPGLDGHFPFLCARCIDDALLQLSLDELDPSLHGVSFCLTQANVYQLLEGKSLGLQLPLLDCQLTPDNHVLRLDVLIEGRLDPCVFPLALSELALAWNLLRNGPTML